jgi:hypothetical protein
VRARLATGAWALSILMLAALLLAACDNGRNESPVANTDPTPSDASSTGPSSCFDLTGIEVTAAGADARGVALALLTQWLDRFESPSCGEAQLTEYDIGDVTLRSETGGELIVGMAYDVHPAAGEEAWLIGNGVAQDDGWVVGKFTFLHIRDEGNDRYRLESFSTSP